MTAAMMPWASVSFLLSRCVSSYVYDGEADRGIVVAIVGGVEARGDGVGTQAGRVQAGADSVHAGAEGVQAGADGVHSH
jgi:hypothetical protein